MDACVDFSVGNVLAAPLPKGCDVVTMNLDAMNHLRNPADWWALLTRACESLKDGGIFLFDINTQYRLLNDWNYPEIIVKRNMTYVQLGSNPSKTGDFERRRLYMVVFLEEYRKITKHAVVVEQIAPSKERLFQELKNAGFSRVTERVWPDEIVRKHIFMKNRLFVTAEK